VFQNTVTNLGISLGTALAGAVLIGALTSAFLTDIADSKAIPTRVTDQATTTLAAGVPFISDEDLDKALKEAGVRGPAADDATSAYSDARLNALRSALFIIAIATVVALFFSGPIPVRPIAGPSP
jgi:hypothetical protein